MIGSAETKWYNASEVPFRLVSERQAILSASAQSKLMVAGQRERSTRQLNCFGSYYEIVCTISPSK